MVNPGPVEVPEPVLDWLGVTLFAVLVVVVGSDSLAHDDRWEDTLGTALRSCVAWPILWSSWKVGRWSVR